MNIIIGTIAGIVSGIVWYYFLNAVVVVAEPSRKDRERFKDEIPTIAIGAGLGVAFLIIFFPIFWRIY